MLQLKKCVDTEEPTSLTGPRRSRLEVQIDILHAVKEGAGRPTHIMYRSNLSWNVMQNFIKSLSVQGLIKIVENERKKRYLLTEKGERLLQVYASVRNQLEPVAPIAM